MLALSLSPLLVFEVRNDPTPKDEEQKGIEQKDTYNTKITETSFLLLIHRRFTANCSCTWHSRGDPGPAIAGALRVKLAEVVLPEMLDVPRVLHGLPVLSLQADRAGPGDAHHPKRASPPCGELICPGQILLPPQNKVSCLKLPGTDSPAMVAAEPLLVAS